MFATLQWLRVAVVVLGVTSAALTPLGLARDSFPLSTFPMFSKARPKVVTMTRVMALAKPEKQGEHREEPVPPSVVASGEVLQAKVAIARAASTPEGARKLCDAVAARLRKRGEVRELLVVRDQLVVPGFLETNEPRTRLVLARCGP